MLRRESDHVRAGGRRPQLLPSSGAHPGAQHQQHVRPHEALQHVRVHLGPGQDLGRLLLGGAPPASRDLQVSYYRNVKEAREVAKREIERIELPLALSMSKIPIASKADLPNLIIKKTKKNILTFSRRKCLERTEKV